MARSQNSYLTRFLSDFTLGFSDGLTVPFALTAGLSSLGRTDTVIYAGLTELCAGSISMGIGGYLSALDEIPSSRSAAAKNGDGDEEELAGMLCGGESSTNSSDDGRGSVDEKAACRDEELVRKHLEPLALSTEALSNVMSSLCEKPHGLQHAASHLRTQSQDVSDADTNTHQPGLTWAIASGLSISLGYVVGGIIPLLPYFFASTVGLGLQWSIGLCLAALMLFGSGKSWILGHGQGDGEKNGWMRLRRCLWSGLQMLILGSLAAAAAVGCVQLLGSGDEGESSSPARLR